MSIHKDLLIDCLIAFIKSKKLGKECKAFVAKRLGIKPKKAKK